MSCCHDTGPEGLLALLVAEEVGRAEDAPALLLLLALLLAVLLAVMLAVLVLVGGRDGTTGTTGEVALEPDVGNGLLLAAAPVLVGVDGRRVLEGEGRREAEGAAEGLADPWFLPLRQKFTERESLLLPLLLRLCKDGGRSTETSCTSICSASTTASVVIVKPLVVGMGVG